MLKPSRIINHLSLAKKLGLWIILIVFPLLLSIPKLWADDDPIKRIEQSTKAMVTVQTELTRLMHTNPPRQATFYRTAAGLILNSSGIIVTNTHTIIDAPFIYVILPDGTRLKAKVLYSSTKYDFSFLKITPPYPLHHVVWADSNLLHPGSPIIAIESSDGGNRFIITGEIKDLIKNKSRTKNDFLKLNLNLHHGDSGGPILDQQGHLLGMIMAKQESQPNVSIAIAANKIHYQYLQLRKNMP